MDYIYVRPISVIRIFHSVHINDMHDKALTVVIIYSMQSLHL